MHHYYHQFNPLERLKLCFLFKGVSSLFQGTHGRFMGRYRHISLHSLLFIFNCDCSDESFEWVGCQWYTRDSGQSRNDQLYLSSRANIICRIYCPWWSLWFFANKTSSPWFEKLSCLSNMYQSKIVQAAVRLFTGSRGVTLFSDFHSEKIKVVRPNQKSTGWLGRWQVSFKTVS